MTLVLSDLSRHGIIMIGDTAVVRREGGAAVSNAGDADKVQYFTEAKIGAAIWGIRSIGETTSDIVLAKFIRDHDSTGLGLEECGNGLARRFNELMDGAGLDTRDRAGGIHLGGYIGENPKLWHVHWSAKGVDGPWALAKDFPEGTSRSEEEMLEDIRERRGNAQLVNGMNRELNMAREAIQFFSRLLEIHSLGTFPHDSILGRIRYVRMLHGMVSAALFVPGKPVYVSEKQKLIAFDRHGIIEGPIYYSTELSRADQQVRRFP